MKRIKSLRFRCERKNNTKRLLLKYKDLKYNPQASYAGTGGGFTYFVPNVQWGTKRLNAKECVSSRSIDVSQEKRETFSYSTLKIKKDIGFFLNCASRYIPTYIDIDHGDVVWNGEQPIIVAIS